MIRRRGRSGGFAFDVKPNNARIEQGVVRRGSWHRRTFELESDAPYLAPVPFRGKRNEPAFVSHTIERLATARATTREALARCTTDNARRLFGLAVPDGRS